MPKRVGRPPKYNKKYCKMIVEYFKDAPRVEEFLKERFTRTLKDGTVEVAEKYGRVVGKFPTFQQFANQIKVNGDTIVEWASTTRTVGKRTVLKYPQFSAAYNKAKELQKEWLIEVGLSGSAPPASFIFVSKNVTDMRDKQDVDHTTQGEKLPQIIGFTYQVPKNPDDEHNANP